MKKFIKDLLQFLNDTYKDAYQFKADLLCSTFESWDKARLKVIYSPQFTLTIEPDNIRLMYLDYVLGKHEVWKTRVKMWIDSSD